ncbi:MAG: hypothetical protein AB7O37_08575 [Vicinamibacteria bacterium]
MTARWLAAVAGLALAAPAASAATRVPIRVERHAPGAPLVFGLPFPKGALASPDHVRVLGPDGREIESQVTEVATWEPADPSIKWAWVFFFAGGGDRYAVEYGADVRPTLPPHRIELVNNQRDKGLAEITTGPLRFVVRQGEGGFLRDVQLDLEGNGFDSADTIAEGPGARGSFLDLLDDAGLDASRASVRQTFIERGSGRLHAVLRVEGEYRYGRSDNDAAPFVLRIHAYAGKPYLRVLLSFVYTGVPDKHRPQRGDYPHLATQAEAVVAADPTDQGWAQPQDRIGAVGLGLRLRLDAPARVRVGQREGRYFEPGAARVAETASGQRPVSLVQTGPKPDRMPPVPWSTPVERLSGFSAELRDGARVLDRAERADGWMDVSDARRGVAIGIRHFLEEYPKELRFDPASGEASAFLWSPAAGPLSLARFSNEPAGEGAIENWARGLAKTGELVLYFHGANESADEIARTLGYVLRPPVAHADPAVYAKSEVWGRFAPRTAAFPELERGLDQKYDWVLFNQAWQPWYGLMDHGDVMVSFDGGSWKDWGNNEPAQDFLLWLQFVRTGDARLFDAAQALSRHTMDVDNTHWPGDPEYRGDSNSPLDYWRAAAGPPGSKWRGIGRRHSAQHWLHSLSAHVWVQGWLADYYLAADQRGLDCAIQTAEMHLRRLFGEHDLTGRRLYLSIFNLVEVWDATKDARYGEELKDRVGRLLRLGRQQGDNLALDRYGYANVYLSHALARYLALTGDPQVRAALVRHARALRDVPPLNHFVESYLASVHTLALGWELTRERSFVDEIRRRVELLRADPLPAPPAGGWSVASLDAALLAAWRLPPDPGRFRPDQAAPARPGWSATNGLRVFGWTHGWGLPWALAALAEAGEAPAP